MNNNKFFALLAIIAIIFTSCTSEDSLVTENPILKKTFKVKKDATGAYSLDFDQDTNIDKVIESSINNRQYYLSSSINGKEKNNLQELLIDNDQLKVGFIDADSDQKQFISIVDDNISFKSKSDDESKLAEYSIQSNQDGTFTLDFNVNDNVDVSFVYNEETQTYEIHLENGDGGIIEFTRTLESELDEPLKIDFVNHIANANAKSSELMLVRKPKIIIGEDDD